MTLVDDIEGLFVNSIANEIFSDKGLSALADFKFWESAIFYTGVLITSTLFIGVIYGYYKDKKDWKDTRLHNLKDDEG